MTRIIHWARRRLAKLAHLRSHLWQSLATYTAQGFGMFFGILLARLLDPTDYGSFGFAVAVVFLALLPAIWTLAPILVSEGGQTAENHTRAAGFGWCVALARLLIVTGLGLYYWNLGKSQTAALCLLIGIAEAGRELNNVQRCYLEGLGNFKPNFISALSGVIFCFVVVVPASQLGWGPFTLVLPGLGGMVMDFFIFRHYSGKSIFVRPSWWLGSELMQKSFWLWIYGASESGLQRVDSWFVGRFQGLVQLAYYNRAFGYAPLSSLVLSSLVTSPIVVGFNSCQTVLARRRLFFHAALILLAGGLVNWVALFFFADPFVHLVFGSKWIGAAPVFKAFAGLSLAYAISQLPTAAMVAVQGYRQIGVIRFCGLLTFVSVLALLPQLRNLIAIAYLVQMSWVLQGVAMLFCARSLLFVSDPPSKLGTQSATSNDGF